MKIAFLLYPTQGVKVHEDSSFWIMHELKRRGHEVFYFESRDLSMTARGPRAYLRKALLHPAKGYLPSQPASQATLLEELQCLFIRKEPPVNELYWNALQILSALSERVFILNDPMGIARTNEKQSALLFPEICADSLVTESVQEANRFVKSLKKDVVIKPIDNKSGVGIVRSGAKDRNLQSLLEMATDFGRRRIMVQRFISADTYGDKRILLLNGEPLGAFLRKPGRADFRANLSAGASMHDAEISASDLKIIEIIKSYLLRNGLYFVGIDVIGRYLTELNVTSPAGIPEINHYRKSGCQKKVADFIERRLRR